MSDLDDFDILSLVVGRLFIKWGDLENAMSAGLRLYLDKQLAKPRGSKADQRMHLAAAIYGSMRLRTSRDICKRILTEQRIGQAHLDFHTKLFEHIAHIEHLRDTLAHQYVRRSDRKDAWVLVDMATTKTFAKPKAYEIEPISILAAAADLHKASFKVSELLPLQARTRADLALPTWRYKPSMLKLLPHKKLLSLREQWLRPEPSPG